MQWSPELSTVTILREDTKSEIASSEKPVMVSVLVRTKPGANGQIEMLAGALIIDKGESGVLYEIPSFILNKENPLEVPQVMDISLVCTVIFFFLGDREMYGSLIPPGVSHTSQSALDVHPDCMSPQQITFDRHLQSVWELLDEAYNLAWDNGVIWVMSGFYREWMCIIRDSARGRGNGA